MAKRMKIIAIVSLLMTIVFCFSYINTNNDILFSLAITSATIAYHFIARLLIGSMVNLIMKNQADYTKKWYQVSTTEMKFL